MDGNFHINYWSKENCYLNQRVVKLSEKELPNIFVRYQVEPYIKLREKNLFQNYCWTLKRQRFKSYKYFSSP